MFIVSVLKLLLDGRFEGNTFYHESFYMLNVLFLFMVVWAFSPLFSEILTGVVLNNPILRSKSASAKLSTTFIDAGMLF